VNRNLQAALATELRQGVGERLRRNIEGAAALRRRNGRRLAVQALRTRHGRFERHRQTGRHHQRDGACMPRDCNRSHSNYSPSHAAERECDSDATSGPRSRDDSVHDHFQFFRPRSVARDDDEPG
jgi:hypothetical protein